MNGRRAAIGGAALLVLVNSGFSAKEIVLLDSNRIAEYREAPGKSVCAALAKFKVKTEDEARQLALAWLVKNHGLLAEEGLEVSGLHRASRRAGGYAEGGNWIWEVKVTEFGSMLSGVILVDAATGEAFGAIPGRHAAQPQPKEGPAPSR